MRIRLNIVWGQALIWSLLLIASASAQTASATTRLAWDQDAPSLEEAQGYVYAYLPDGATTGTVLRPVTCIKCEGGACPKPFFCSVLFPAFTPAKHTLTVFATNEAGPSLPSTPLAFQFVVVPATPHNPRIVRP